MMKYLFLTIVSFLTFSTVHSQPWLELLPSKKRSELTLFDYQHAFETYWAPYEVDNGYYVQDGVKKKAPGWKQFRRWEYMMKLKANPVTGEFPQQSAAEIVDIYFKNHPSSRGGALADWKPLGPFGPEITYSGLGRINCIGFHPTDPNTIWAGAPSGGLWVTHDHGQSWQCLTDQNESLGVTDMIISDDYDMDGTVYIATGDRDSYDNQSVGVLVTHDYGVTWQPTGLSYTINQHKFINRLLRHPDDPLIMIAATGDGVFRTSDGGVTWDEQLTDRVFMDMEFHPTDPNIIYGSIAMGQIYRSTNGGQNWTRTLLVSQAGRTELAVSPAQPDWLYAVMSQGSLRGVYKSIDKGETFTLTIDGDTLNLLDYNANGAGTGGQGWYDLAIAASLVDANVIFVGGINTWKSIDGGTSWILSNFSGNHPSADYCHADKHALTFRPDGFLFEGNDGGLNFTPDDGETWNNITQGMAISQMYKLGISQTEKDYMLAGLQDNGSKMHSPGTWMDVGGGDGMECMIDPVNADIQYHSSQYGNLFRTFDRWETGRFIKPNAAGSGEWVTPFVLDPSDPKTIYGGFKEIWKTTDRGESWTQVSSVNETSKFRTIAVAPSDPNVVYATGPQNIYKSSTGGEPFVKLPWSIASNSGSLSYLAIKNDDPLTVWISSSSAFTPGVFQSIDGGQTWTDITTGIPEIPIYCVIQNKQVTDRVDLYAGTEQGVYYKQGDAEWVRFNDGLPKVIVTELEIYYDADPKQSLLRAATYGRGMWETRLLFDSSIMTYVSSTSSHPTLEPIKPGYPNQEIMKIEVYTNGDLEPLHVTSFNFSTKGSTNALKDISSARVYYTSNINGFLTMNPFGLPFIKPNSDFNITGDQALSSGVNYFWLAYDLTTDATEGNFVDATCDSFTISSNIVPAITSPDSSRHIEVVYCDAGATNLAPEHINQVTIGTVDQLSEKGVNGYEDYSLLTPEVIIGEAFDITVHNSDPHNTNALLIWIDYNRDGDFEDNGELVYDSGPAFIPLYNVQVTPPANAHIGLTRMRIRLHDTSFGPNPSPCGNSNIGEVEDYGLIIQDVMSSSSVFENETSFSVFPNPFDDTFIIKSKMAVNNTKFHITDMMGRVVYSGILEKETEVDLKHCSPGMYVVKTGKERVEIVKMQ